MRKITGFITPSMETIYAYESNVEQANAFGSSRFGLPVVQPYACCWFYYSFSQMPTSIIVKQEIYNNGAITTVNFKEFCQVATACEFSYDSYPIEYLRTGALCVRNYAWYYYINDNNSSLGYHITDNSSKHFKLSSARYTSFQYSQNMCSGKLHLEYSNGKLRWESFL